MLTKNQKRAIFWSRFMPTLRLRLWISRKLDPAPPTPFCSAKEIVDMFDMLGGVEHAARELSDHDLWAVMAGVASSLPKAETGNAQSVEQLLDSLERK